MQPMALESDNRKEALFLSKGSENTFHDVPLSNLKLFFHSISRESLAKITRAVLPS
jgi:hypothetical protein